MAAAPGRGRAAEYWRQCRWVQLIRREPSKEQAQTTGRVGLKMNLRIPFVVLVCGFWNISDEFESIFCLLLIKSFCCLNWNTVLSFVSHAFSILHHSVYSEEMVKVRARVCPPTTMSKSENNTVVSDFCLSGFRPPPLHLPKKQSVSEVGESSFEWIIK